MCNMDEKKERERPSNNSSNNNYGLLMTFLWSSSTFIKTKLTNKGYLYMCNMDEKKERERPTAITQR